MFREKIRVPLSILQKVVIEATIGSAPSGPFVCSGTDANTLKCANSVDPTEFPPLEIVVDYGDGSGPMTWLSHVISPNEERDVWSHTYTKPGKYEISVLGEREALGDRNAWFFFFKRLDPLGPCMGCKAILLNVCRTE